MDLTVDRQTYGGFSTDADHEHIPDGECLNWAYKRSTLTVVEDFIATVPGKLGPLKHPRPPK